MSQISDDVVDEERIAADLSHDERFELLASERRRLALEVLSDRDTPLGLDDLATAVATRRSDDLAPDSDAVERTAVSLHHAHLPRLADANVIEYDTGAQRVDDAKRVSIVRPF
jgi:hypothetical protein